MGFRGFGRGGPHGGMPHGFGAEEEERERKIPDRVLLRRLLGYLRFYKLKLAITLSMISVSTLATVYSPVIFQKAIDDYVMPSALQESMRINGLVAMIALLVILQVSSLVANFIQTRLMTEVTQGVIYKIRQDIFAHLQSLSLRYFTDERVGVIVSKVTNDTELLSDFLTLTIPMLINDTIPLIVSFYIMFNWNVELAFVTLAIVPLFLVPVFLFRLRARRVFRRTRRTIADVTSTVEETVSGIRVIQSMAKERDASETFAQANVRNLRANISASVLFASFGSGMEVLQAVAQCITIWFGANLILSGKMTVGIFFSFQVYLLQFFRPIMAIAMFYNQFEASMAATERIFGLLDESIEVAEAPKESMVELPPLKGEIQYKDVTFGYDPKVPILKDVNLRISPKEMIAIVGPTGAGKSSLINLLCRFYDPQQGGIYVDGYDIKLVSLKSLRSQMSIVLQDTFLFQGTVKENIRYGRLDATDEDIIEAAKSVGAHDFILRLPKGYDTVIRERATNISVGQRQLISFARALIANPAILILDEATSSVDPYTELVIQDGLTELLRNRTAIVIAHRISTVRNADRIIVVKDGAIVEEGDHKGLLKKDGLYNMLYKIQFRDVENDYSYRKVELF